MYDQWTPTEYDPPLLVARGAFPWVDERYRGPFYNLAGHVYHAAQLGVQVQVHPSAFVVHYAHEGEPDDQQGVLAHKV